MGERFLGVEEVVSSSLVVPTNNENPKALVNDGGFSAYESRLATMKFARRKFSSGGFVLAEFAIALPLLILLGWGLAVVGVKIFQQGKAQLADYVLEEETQYVMEQITQQARVATAIERKKFTDKIHQLKIVYQTLNDRPEIYYPDNSYSILTIADVSETQYYIPRWDNEKNFYVTLNAKRQDDGTLSNPITGANSFGDTKINVLRYDADEAKKILHITIELESLVTGRTLRLNTAVFMPTCEKIIIR